MEGELGADEGRGSDAERPASGLRPTERAKRFFILRAFSLPGQSCLRWSGRSGALAKNGSASSASSVTGEGFGVV